MSDHGNSREGQHRAAEQHNSAAHAHDTAGGKGQSDHLTPHELSVREHQREQEQARELVHEETGQAHRKHPVPQHGA